MGSSGRRANRTRAYVLRRHLFGRFDLEPERIAIEGERGRQVAHRNPHVVEHGFHVNSLSRRLYDP